MNILLSLILASSFARAARLDAPMRDHVIKVCQKVLEAEDEDWVKIKIRRSSSPPEVNQPNLFVVAKTEEDKQVVLYVYRGDMEQMLKSAANTGDGGMYLADQNIERLEMSAEEYAQFKKDNPKVGQASIKFLVKDNALTRYWGPNSLLPGDVVQIGRKFNVLLATQHQSEWDSEDKEFYDTNTYSALKFDQKIEIGSESNLTKDFVVREKPTDNDVKLRLVGSAEVEGTFQVKPGEPTLYSGQVTGFKARKPEKQTLRWIVLGKVAAKK